MIPALWLMVFGCNDGDQVGQACNEMAVASVSVTLTDTAGDAIEAGTVTYTVDGGASTACEVTSSTTFVCGYEKTGHFVVIAEGPDNLEQSQVVDVELDADGCHPVHVSLTFHLEEDEEGCLLPGCGGDTGD
jgi:hypothetical protein